MGFKVRGQEPQEAPLAMIPQSLANADVSVCGVKGFMIDETREFINAEGQPEVVDCASIAALEITDSPVHVHGVTHEVYTILKGTGKMILGNKVVDVQEGNVITLPPGVEHGLVSDDPAIPVKVLLSFKPGLAPKTKPEFRDEAIIAERTSEQVRLLLNL